MKRQPKRRADKLNKLHPKATATPGPADGSKHNLHGGREFLFTPVRRNLLFASCLVACIVIAYQPVWHAGYIWDDDAHLTENPCIVGSQGFKGIWTTAAATYYPLVLTSFWIGHVLWGLNPLPYHLANVAMHAICALLFWKILRVLRVPGAWLGAALWALHPVQVESVAWITELKNTQSCCFYLLAILFFLKWRSAGTFAERKGSEREYLLAWFCAALAILSKTSTVMLPIVLGLLWWGTERRWRWRNLFRLAPFLAISAGAGLWTIWEQQFHSGASGLAWTQSWGERLAIAGRIVWFYLGKLIWPHPLLFIYPRWKIDPNEISSYLPAAAVAFALLLLWMNRDHRRWMWPVFFAFAYFVVSLFPVMDFFKVYFFQYSFTGDHFQYLASLGPVALAAAGTQTATDRIAGAKRLLLTVPAVAVLMALGVLTWKQCGMYASSEMLWETTLRSNPAAWMAHNNLGFALLKKGNVDEAMDQFAQTLRLKPDNASAHENLGVCLSRKGKMTDAISEFGKALQLDPKLPQTYNDLGLVYFAQGRMDEAASDFQKAFELSPDYADAHFNFGNLLNKEGRVNDAIVQYNSALEIRPDLAAVRLNLGNCYSQLGRFDEAVAELKKVVEHDQDNADAHYNLGNSLYQIGRVDEAMTQLQKAAELRPNDADAQYNLGGCFVRMGRMPEAIKHFQKADELAGGKNPAFLRSLAAAFAAAGRLDAAVQSVQRAIPLAQAAGQQDLTRQLKEELERYETGRPIRR